MFNPAKASSYVLAPAKVSIIRYPTDPSLSQANGALGEGMLFVNRFLDQVDTLLHAGTNGKGKANRKLTVRDLGKVCKALSRNFWAKTSDGVVFQLFGLGAEVNYNSDDD